jgi:hypothetical protein
MFFAKPDEPARILPSEDEAKIPAFREELAAIRTQIARIGPTAFGGVIVANELDLAARMLDFGAFRLQKLRDPSVKSGDTIALIANDFEEAWLDRSERGGLSDSVARIAAIG